ncbi:MAG: hypothetical protein A2W21_02335 [Betaproteobacteria bacterium RBG_16_66_20]|nr:MAG: hypothetical protein A2W21_02335 [Betaproteobacteria bacterium RBG_16_66_20]
MRRLPLLLLALIAIPAALADDLSDRISSRTTVMFYFKKPLDGSDKRDAAGSFGFRLDRSPSGNVALLRTPIVDVSFNDRGFNALAFRGSVLHQNQPASGAPAPEINWWIVGGIAVGAAIVINNDNKSKNDTPAKKGGGS